jgi:hypothetical protein
MSAIFFAAAKLLIEALFEDRVDAVTVRLGCFPSNRLI